MVTLYFVVQLVYTLVSDGVAELLSFWGGFDAVLTALCVAQISVYVQVRIKHLDFKPKCEHLEEIEASVSCCSSQRMLTDTSLEDQYLKKPGDFTSFAHGLRLACDWYNLSAVLVFCMTVWVRDSFSLRLAASGKTPNGLLFLVHQSSCPRAEYLS